MIMSLINIQNTMYKKQIPSFGMNSLIM